MSQLTNASVRQFAAHVASQRHAMAGVTIATSAGLACGLGEACVRITALRLESDEDRALAEATADRLAAIRPALQDLADEDGAAITTFAALREAGKELEGQERLCQMPVEVCELAIEAALLLQDFRPLALAAEDDLEMAIVLLHAAARSSTLLLDSNLRIWPDPKLLAAFEPQLAGLRERLGRVQPVGQIRY